MGRRSNMGISHNEGPAEAATSPSHGPTTLEETAMDKPMKNTAAPRRASDAFHDFASGVDVNLRSTRAKLCAVHTLLENGRDPGEEVMDARGRLFDGKIEVDLSRCKPKAAVASKDIDERAACRALDLDGWVARRRAGCRIKGAARRRPKKTVRLYQPTEAPPQSAREAMERSSSCGRCGPTSKPFPRSGCAAGLVRSSGATVGRAATSSMLGASALAPGSEQGSRWRAGCSAT